MKELKQATNENTKVNIHISRQKNEVAEETKNHVCTHTHKFMNLHPHTHSLIPQKFLRD